MGAFSRFRCAISAALDRRYAHRSRACRNVSSATASFPTNQSQYSEASGLCDQTTTDIAEAAANDCGAIRTAKYRHRQRLRQSRRNVERVSLVASLCASLAGAFASPITLAIASLILAVCIARIVKLSGLIDELSGV